LRGGRRWFALLTAPDARIGPPPVLSFFAVCHLIQVSCGGRLGWSGWSDPRSLGGNGFDFPDVELRRNFLPAVF